MLSTVAATLFLAFGAPAVPAGPAKIEVTVDDRDLTVHTYKPAAYAGGPMLVVFHGLARNAEEYRDHARGLANRRGMLVVAPEFDQARFPYKQFTRGGLVRDGAVTPRQDWVWSLVPKLVDEIRRREGQPDLPFYVIGHSAGGQFVCRMSGFVHLIVPLSAFQLLAGADALVSYRFNTGVAEHKFCAACGIHSFYTPRSDPEKVDVNVRCLDDVDLSALELQLFDGKQWEEAIRTAHWQKCEKPNDAE